MENFKSTVSIRLREILIWDYGAHWHSILSLKGAPTQSTTGSKESQLEQMTCSVKLPLLHNLIILWGDSFHFPGASSGRHYVTNCRYTNLYTCILLNKCNIAVLSLPFLTKHEEGWSWITKSLLLVGILVRNTYHETELWWDIIAYYHIFLHFHDSHYISYIKHSSALPLKFRSQSTQSKLHYNGMLSP